MAFAFFDMDGTIIDGDSNDISYYELNRMRIVDDVFIQKLNNYEDMFYKGILDINEFVEFASTPFIKYSMEDLDEILGSIVRRCIVPKIKKGARDRIESHHANNDRVIIVTATNDYLVKHVAKALDIDDFIASSMEVNNNHLTGKKLCEVPFKEGKVRRIREYLKDEVYSLDGSYGYGDSVNDIEMLLMCEHGVLVDPNENMLKDPRVRSMEVISFK